MSEHLVLLSDPSQLHCPRCGEQELTIHGQGFGRSFGRIFLKCYVCYGDGFILETRADRIAWPPPDIKRIEGGDAD